MRCTNKKSVHHDKTCPFSSPHECKDAKVKEIKSHQIVLCKYWKEEWEENKSTFFKILKELQKDGRIKLKLEKEALGVEDASMIYAPFLQVVFMQFH